MNTSGASDGQPASELISKRIAELGDWRGETLARMRKLIKEADPDVVEEWKWMGTPVWSHDGIICTGESYKKVVKLTFAKGASLEGSGGALQLEPRRQRAPRDRHPRRRRGRRSPRSRRSFARRSPSTAPARRRLRRSRSRGFRQPQADQPTESHSHMSAGGCDGTIRGDVPGSPVSQSRRSGGSPMSSIRWGSSGGTRTTSPERTIRI